MPSMPTVASNRFSTKSVATETCLWPSRGSQSMVMAEKGVPMPRVRAVVGAVKESLNPGSRVLGTEWVLGEASQIKDI